MRRIFLVLGLCLALISGAYAQQAVTGTVVDDEGMGIPGVSILQAGTTNGTITNIDGEYMINVPGDATLQFSFVGMLNVEELVGDRSVINVTMREDAIGIDEVVVTALGIKRESKALGYAMTEVKGDEIAQTNTVNPVQALQGKSAGLSIGSSDGGLAGNSKIQIRGVSVLNSNNNQPIFVVDGVILESGVSNASADWDASSNDFGNILKNLNPDDYESISVLKGAAATALYGSRGINGAVIIKTKDGRGRKGLGVKVTQSVGFDHVFGNPELQYEYGPGTLAGYVNYGEKDANGNYYRFDVNQVYSRDVNGEMVMTKIGNPNSGFMWGPRYDGRAIEDYDGSIGSYTGFKNNMKDAYDLGVNSNTAVALSGATDKGSFYLSNSYNYREGTAPTNEFERYSLLFKGTYDLASWLHADASIAFNTSKVVNPANDLSSSFVTGEWAGWYDTKRWNKKEIYQAPHGGVPSNSYGDTYGNVPGNGTWYTYNLNSSVQNEQVTRPIVRLTADLAPWISVTAEGNMNHYSKVYELKNFGTGYAQEGGEYRLRHDVDVSRTGKLVFNLKKTFGDYQTSAMIGGEMWDQETSFTQSRTDGGLIVPGRFYLANSKKTPIAAAGIAGTKQVNSLYFLLSGSWKDQIFLDVTGRNDWSSALVYSNGNGNYSYFYPSISSSWIFTQSFDLPEMFSFGKLRASWAQVGNDTAPYLINRGYALENWEMDNGNIYLNTKNTMLVDPNIKPERKNSMEVGLDLRMFNNRLSADVAYYNEAITDQISTIPLPSESGLNQMLTNVGTMTNKGFELSLGFTPVRTKDFEWKSTFNYWNNKTVISDLIEEMGEYKVLGGYVNYGNFRVGSVAFEDGEYGVLMSDAAPKKDKDGNKILNWNESRRGAHYTRSGEVEKVGKINPDFEGSWDNNVTFKNWNFSVLLDARFGGHIASYSNKYGTAYGILGTSLKGRDEKNGGITWTSQYPDTKGQVFHDGIIPDGVFADGQVITTPAGAQVNVGGMSYQEAYEAGYVEPTHASFYTYFNNAWSSGVINDDWFSEVNYIALRNVSVGYNLPKSIAQKIKAQNLYVSLNARNLGYLYNSLPNKLNPESFRGTTSSQSYFERSFTPYTATYTMSISIDF